MKLPLQVVFRNMEKSDWLEEEIRKRAKTLDTFCKSIMSGRVVVEMPHRHHAQGNAYLVRIDLTVKDGEIVINHEPDEHVAYEDIHAAMKDAFDSARRKLKDYMQHRRHQEKSHQKAQPAQVCRILPEQGYGFLVTADGKEIYFHANSLLNGQLDSLRLGTKVIFVEEKGEKGPQASTVKVVKETQKQPTALIKFGA